jgi:uncharacterized protein with GYD domain
MPKYLIEASYSPEGIAGIKDKGGSSRRDAVAQTVEGLGGKLESFYFGFGDADAYVTVEMPDNESVAAVALAVNAGGAVAIKTVVLLTPEEIDSAAKLSVDYRGPDS